MTSAELDAAAGLQPRTNGNHTDRSVKLIVCMAAVAGALAVAAIVLAIINFGQISQQVDDLDRLTRAQAATIATGYAQPVRDACRLQRP